MAVTIKNLDSYGSFGWQWDIEFVEGGERMSFHHYRTSHDGDGLWMNGKQIEGTTQFRVRGEKNNVMRQLLRRWPNNE